LGFFPKDSFYAYEKLGFTCEDDFFGQDVFPFYTDIPQNIISILYPFSES